MHLLKVRIKGLVSCPVSGLTQNSTIIEPRREKKNQSSGFLTRADTETALACKFAFNLISR